VEAEGSNPSNPTKSDRSGGPTSLRQWGVRQSDRSSDESSNRFAQTVSSTVR
jgi:hypothetical protein